MTGKWSAVRKEVPSPRKEKKAILVDVIAKCADVTDIMTAVNFGRDYGLRVAIRGGDHNGPGFDSVNDGLAIDMSAMKGARLRGDKSGKADRGQQQVRGWPRAMSAIRLATNIG
jgi:FAD/FMN-containing dehydrogenase